MADVVNYSAYKFAPLENLPALQEHLRAVAAAGDLRGTILLSPEGINLFVAGERIALARLLAVIHAVPGLADLAPKESLSTEKPFNRMLVKIKKEIITMRHPLIKPELGRAPSVDASTLKRWLDQGVDDAGKPVVMMETRNAFEVDVGTFENTLSLGLKSFGDLPQATPALAQQARGRPVVTSAPAAYAAKKPRPG